MHYSVLYNMRQAILIHHAHLHHIYNKHYIVICEDNSTQKEISALCV